MLISEMWLVTTYFGKQLITNFATVANVELNKSMNAPFHSSNGNFSTFVVLTEVSVAFWWSTTKSLTPERVSCDWSLILSPRYTSFQSHSSSLGESNTICLTFMWLNPSYVPSLHQGNCMAICWIHKATSTSHVLSFIHSLQPKMKCLTSFIACSPFLRNTAKQISGEVHLEESGSAVSSLQKSQTSKEGGNGTKCSFCGTLSDDLKMCSHSGEAKNILWTKLSEWPWKKHRSAVLK